MASAQRIKVLHLIDGLLVGGAEKSLLEIIRRFQGTEAVVCHIYQDKPLKSSYEAAGIRVLSLDVPGKYSFVTATRKVLQVIRHEKPVLIHATLYRACIVSRVVSLMTGIPLINSFVSESWGPIRYRGLGRLARMKRDALKWLDRLTAPIVDLFIANSATIATSNSLYLNVPERKVKVIYRGRAADEFVPLPAQIQKKLRAELGIDEGAKVLLCIGRFWGMKRHEDILRAMPAILAAYPEVRLLLAGDGPLAGRLRALVKELGVTEQVVFLGMRQDIPALLQVAEIVVAASEYEGLPGAVIEAMLAGCPLVLSRIPVHEEMIRDEETGLFFNLYDSCDLVRQVIRLLGDPVLQERLVNAALAEARNKYDTLVVAALYEQIYTSLCE